MIAGKIAQIVDTISYLNQFRGKTFLIKLGGSILHNDTLIASLCFDLKLLKQAGINIIIVHGGSKAINQALAEYHAKSEFIDGLRVTSSQNMKIIEMVLCGHVNKLLVRKLNHIGIQAVGLSGSDNNMLQCDHYSKQHGYAGTVNSVNVEPVTQLISAKSNAFDVIPVIAPVGVNNKGEAMNVNADHAASHLAIGLKVDKLIYLTDQDGIYDKDKNRLSELSYHDLMALIKDETVYGGMLIKVKAILTALQQHLNSVHILNGSKKHILIQELFTVNGVGTLCKTTNITKPKREAIA